MQLLFWREALSASCGQDKYLRYRLNVYIYFLWNTALVSIFDLLTFFIFQIKWSKWLQVHGIRRIKSFGIPSLNHLRYIESKLLNHLELQIQIMPSVWNPNNLKKDKNLQSLCSYKNCSFLLKMYKKYIFVHILLHFIYISIKLLKKSYYSHTLGHCIRVKKNEAVL